MIELDTSKFEKSLAEIGGGDPTVVIGFNTNYAIYVHEILTNKHTQGQAKYLEAALQRAVSQNLVERHIAAALKNVTTIEQIQPTVAKALEQVAAATILGDAQELCPIKTGALAASATWSGEEGVGSGKNPNNVTVKPAVKQAAKKGPKKGTKAQRHKGTKGKSGKK